MDIRCPQCETVYEVEDHRITSESATLKCRECQHIFRLGADARPSREDQQRWMVRDPDSGDVLYFDGFQTLHAWIRDGKVDRSWEISRSGRSWKTLGKMGELAPMFQVANTTGSGGQGADRRTEQAAGPRPGSQGQTRHQASARAARPADTSSSGGDSQTQSGGTAPGTPGHSSESRGDSEAGSPQVQLESGRFGSRDDTDPQDEQQGWSFDDETPVESAPSEMSRVDAFAHSPVWWSVGAVVIMLLGAGAYVVADRTGLVDRLRGFVSGESSPQTANISMEAPRDGVHGAMQKAARRAESRAAERFNAGRAEASDVVARGVETAMDRAQQAQEQKAQQQQAQESKSRGFEATIAAADRALRNGAAQRALELYRRASKLQANSPQAQTGVGWALLNLGRTQPAAEAFRQALAARQNYGDALIGLGKAERERGRPKQALDAYRRYLEAHPDGPKKSIAEYQADQLEQQLGL